MKKYLIAGALALVCNGLLTSCSEDMGNYSSLEEAKKAQFAQNFEKFYGTPNPNQDWGFGEASLTRAVARTRSHNVNGNLWYQNWERPINVTADEASKVLAAFSVKRENQTNAITINWDNYWVHQVHQSNNTYYDGYGQNTGDIHTKMNKIIAYNTSGNGNYYEHVNNFNNGTNTTVYTDDETHQEYIGTTLMVNMGTSASANNQFGYHNTLDSKDHFEYFIIAGADIDASLTGYYYVGFDFCASHPDGQEANKNMDVNRDWIYNDWIVRISPGIPVGSGGSTGGNISSNTDGTEVYTKQHVLVHKWVFCEDLGSSSSKRDYDYNDLVFDARIVDEYKVIKNADGTESEYTADTSHRYYAKLTPLAAGGEYVMWFDQNNQPIHSLFVPSTANNVLINTCKSEQELSLSHIEGLSAQTIIYEFNSEEEANINNITIFVRSATATYDLTANSGEAPHKLCVPPGTRWPYERTDIKDAYSGFTEYVENRINPWNDGVEDNLYPLDDVPDSLKTDQYNQYTYIKDSDNSTENTTYNVSLTDSETSIWSGENDFANWNGNNAARIEASKFSKVGEGTVIRFYGVANSSFNVKAIYLDSWNDIDLGDSRWITGQEKCNYGNSALHSYIELKLNATTAENFKSKGMLVYGNQFKLLCVSYDNTNKKTSQGEANDPAYSKTIWKGSSTSNITISNNNFSQAAENQILRIYGTRSMNSYWIQVYAYQWESLNISGWTEGYGATSSDLWHGEEQGDGYVQFTLTASQVSKLQEKGMYMHFGNGLTITEVKLLSDTEFPAEENNSGTITGDVLWSNTNGVAVGWDHNIQITKDQLATANANSRLRFYGNYTNSSQWQIYLKDTNDTDICQVVWAASDIIDAVGYVDLTFGDYLTKIKSNGIYVMGANFTLTHVTLIK